MAAPRILAFDTSGPWCAVAVLADRKIKATAYEEMHRGQAEALMPMIGACLHEADLSWDDLDAIAVGIGPGNFTGTRVSVAAARGAALGLGIPAIGVSTFDALAHEAEGPLLLLVDGPRDAHYVQTRMGDEISEITLRGTHDMPPTPAGTNCIGMRSDLVSDVTGLNRSSAAYAPASAIARVGAERLASGTPIPRPAPLYIRSPDAAPPSDPPPVILP